MCGEITTQTLQTWLEWAGARLVAMPVRNDLRARSRVVWPDYDQNTFEILSFRGQLPLRAAAPSRNEIDMVDEILLLPNACPDVFARRILHVRALVHPINGRYLYPWRRIAKLLRSDHKTVKRQHKRGLRDVLQHARPEAVCGVAKFMETYAA